MFKVAHTACMSIMTLYIHVFEVVSLFPSIFPFYSHSLSFPSILSLSFLCSVRQEQLLHKINEAKTARAALNTMRREHQDKVSVN